FNDARYRFAPAVLKGVLEVRRRDIDDWQMSYRGMLLPDSLDIAVDVVALGFRHAGRANANNFRFGAVIDVEPRLLHVLIAAQHRCDFTHRGRLHRYGFFEVSREQHQAERSAALRAMEQRHRAAQAHKGERATDRLT